MCDILILECPSTLKSFRLSVRHDLPDSVFIFDKWYYIVWYFCIQLKRKQKNNIIFKYIFTLRRLNSSLNRIDKALWVDRWWSEGVCLWPWCWFCPTASTAHCLTSTPQVSGESSVRCKQLNLFLGKRSALLFCVQKCN